MNNDIRHLPNGDFQVVYDSATVIANVRRQISTLERMLPSLGAALQTALQHEIESLRAQITALDP